MYVYVKMILGHTSPCARLLVFSQFRWIIRYDQHHFADNSSVKIHMYKNDSILAIQF